MLFSGNVIFALKKMTIETQKIESMKDLKYLVLVFESNLVLFHNVIPRQLQA